MGSAVKFVFSVKLAEVDITGKKLEVYTGDSNLYLCRDNNYDSGMFVFCELVNTIYI